jgi:heptosyltransferase-3
VSLLAPAAPAGALVGPREIAEVLPWDGAEMAALLAGDTTHGPVEAAVSSADAVVAYTRSAPVLEALGRRARRLVARDPAPPPGGPHASLWLAEGLAPLAVDPRHEPPSLLFTEAEGLEAEALAAGMPAGFLAVHPGSGSRAKNWPFDRFVETARRLSPGRTWLLILGPAEEDVSPPPRARLARSLPLRTLGAVLARAGLFLGNDSGVSHLAGACGTRTLALFGPTDPAQWAPVGRAVLTLRPPSGDRAAQPVDEVVAAASRLALSSPASG